MGQSGGTLRIVALLLVWALVACTGEGKSAPAPAAQASAVCTEAGICVGERFVAFYTRHGPLIGDPISPPSLHQGREVQYFEAGRLEYVAEYPQSYAVGLAYLGEELCGRQPPLHYRSVPSSLDPDARYYRETGHSLRSDMRRFVERNGGVGVFGPPISEPRTVGEATVQDFVRVQVRCSVEGECYLAPLGRLLLNGGELPGDLCPSIPADDPDA